MDEDKKSVRVAVVEEMVGGLWQGGRDLDCGELWGSLHTAARGPAAKDPWSGHKDSGFLGKWEFNGTGFYRVKVWEVLRV